MNILIVNAFGNSPSAKAKFSSFCEIIKSLFKKVSEKSGIDNFFFIYRTPKTITDFIYNYDSNPGEATQNDSLNKKNFDKIDIVFIEGGEKYLPWDDKGFRLSEFVKLCKVNGKIIYLGGVGFEILIYYLATGARNEYNFINAKGEIQAIEEIQKIPSNFLTNLKKNDNFLDFVTGDILEYRSVYHTWVPIMNIGLHKQIAAEKFMERGKFVLPDGFKGKDYVKNKNTLVSNCHEIKVNVLRQYLSHYLLIDLPVEFVAYTTLTWFPHFFNVSFKRFQFKVICQCDKGPVVIEHENSIGIAFHPQVNYIETVKILENFVSKKFQEVQDKLFSFKKTDIKIVENELPLMFRNYKLNDEQRKGKKLLDDQFISSNNKSNVGKVNSSRSFNRIKKVRNEAGHVGFGFNNRDMIFVENNAIIQKSILYNKKKIQEILSPEQQRQEILNDMFSIKRNENTRISTIFQPIITNKKKKINQKNIFQTLKEGKNIDEDDENGLEYMTFIDRGKMDEKQLIAFYKKARRRVCLKLDEIEHTTNFETKNYEKYKDSKQYKNFIKKQKKAKFNLTDTNFYNKRNKNKNKLKNTNSLLILDRDRQKKINTLNMEAAYQSLMKNVDKDTNKKNTYYKTQPNFYTKKKYSLTLKKNDSNKEDNEDLDYFYNNKNDAKNRIKELQEKWKEYDQLSPEQRQRREFLESKKKWVSKEDFHRVFGIHTTAIKPIPNVMSYGKPVTDYKFREINHEKWLTPNGFV